MYKSAIKQIKQEVNESLVYKTISKQLKFKLYNKILLYKKVEQKTIHKYLKLFMFND